jgi:hypothetical protein
MNLGEGINLVLNHFFEIALVVGVIYVVVKFKGIRIWFTGLIKPRPTVKPVDTQIKLKEVTK